MATLIRLEWTATCTGPCGELYRGPDAETARKTAEAHTKAVKHATSQKGQPVTTRRP